MYVTGTWCDLSLSATIHEYSTYVEIMLLFLFQFYDLQKLFKTGGEIPDTSYVFMVMLSHVQCTCDVVYMYIYMQ